MRFCQGRIPSKVDSITIHICWYPVYTFAPHLARALPTRKCSDVTSWIAMGEEGHTLRARIEALSHPGVEQTRQAHASLRAFGGTRAVTAGASNDQRAHAAFGQMLVRRYTRDSDPPLSGSNRSMRSHTVCGNAEV